MTPKKKGMEYLRALLHVGEKIERKKAWNIYVLAKFLLNSYWIKQVMSTETIQIKSIKILHATSQLGGAIIVSYDSIGRKDSRKEHYHKIVMANTFSY